jgi:hypothetical protein
MQGEYRGDFTRDSFHPEKHFSRVLMQQGRVQLDADWNEQSSILLHYLRSLGADMIGPFGGPAAEGGLAGNGFSVSIQKNLAGDFTIGRGHYYVEGILCELNPPAVPITLNGQDVTLLNTDLPGAQFQVGQWVEIFDDGNKFPNQYFQVTKVTGNSLTLDPAPPAFQIPKLRHAVTYTTQPDLPLAAGSDITNECLVYLDVWERHITWLEDASCREVALGGPDTATRAKIVWQVKVNPVKLGLDNNNKVDNFTWRKYVSDNLQPANRGLLKAWLQPQTASTDPCTISPSSSYRGAENQLYRVEINNPFSGKVTDPTLPTATFKWSRENGTVCSPILQLATNSGQTTITLANLGRDEKLGFHEADWAEIVDDISVLRNQPGTLLKVVGVDSSKKTVTLGGTLTGTVGTDSTRHPLLRRWDQKDGDATTGGVQLAKDGAVPIVEGDWISLEDGIQVQFQKEGNYRTGDYWLIPARTATGNIEWPSIPSTQPGTQPTPHSLAPHGISHYYAPLAQMPTNIQAVNATLIDLRRNFTTQAK